MKKLLLFLAAILFCAGTAHASQLEWNWEDEYLDPVHYFRTVAANSTGGIPISTGTYPVNYKVSDGMTIGGVFATGTSNGTLPIRIQLPIAASTLPTASGIEVFYSHFTCDVQNPLPCGHPAGAIQMGLGVDQPSQVNEPMYPWLGVDHEQDPLQGKMNSVTVPANTTIMYSGDRLDIVDIAFVPGIPNWPNWAMNYNSTSLLYPALTITYANTALVPLQVGGCHVVGYAVAY